MMRPGRSVNRPVTTSADQYRIVIVRRWFATRWVRANVAPASAAAMVTVDNPCIQLKCPDEVIANDDDATTSIKATHVQPNRRCASPPPRSRSKNAPIATADKAAAT